MTNIDFQQQASVMWHSRFPPKGKVDRGETRRFDELRDAIRFVMEKLLPDVRVTAFINCESDSMKIGEIEEVYKTNPEFQNLKK